MNGILVVVLNIINYGVLLYKTFRIRGWIPLSGVCCCVDTFIAIFI